jgi:integrase
MTGMESLEVTTNGRGSGHAAAEHERRGLGPALLFHSDARPAGSGAPAHHRAVSAADTGSSQRRGSDLLLRAATAPKYKAAFAIAYGAGLRASEVVALKVGDIDSERMLLRVERGKGRKDRHAMLSPQLLELLRAWWREGRRSLLLSCSLPPGRYACELIKEDSGQWRFSRRTVFHDHDYTLDGIAR